MQKTFARPLKALDFQTSSGEVYEACPHCLTRISSTDKKTAAQANDQELKPSETKTLCTYHLGYLCEREEKAQLPDECIVCEDIVVCMLKTLRV
jgi:hypothetical protein